MCKADHLHTLNTMKQMYEPSRLLFLQLYEDFVELHVVIPDMFYCYMVNIK